MTPPDAPGPDGNTATPRGVEAGACQRLREEAAVALLSHQQVPAEALAHATICPPCRDELSGFGGLVPLLEAVRAEPLPPAVPPSELLLPHLLAEASRRRHRRRWVSALVAGVAAAGLVAVTIPVGMAIGRRSGTETALPASSRTAASAPAGTAAATSAPPTSSSGPSTAPTGGGEATADVHEVIARGDGTDEQSGGWAKVTLSATEWGSVVTVEVGQLPPGTRCRLVVVDRTGRRLDAGSWTVPDQGYVEATQTFRENALTPAQDVTWIDLTDDRTKRVMMHIRVVAV